MPKETEISLAQQKTNLEERISQAQDWLTNLPKAGWVEQHLADRGPDQKRGSDFTKRLPNLHLEGVDAITYFERLVKHVKPLQLRIRDRILPRIDQKIEAVEAQITQVQGAPKGELPARRAETGMTVLNLISLTNHLIDLVPGEVTQYWSATSTLTPLEFQEQAKALATYMLNLHKGEVPKTQSISLLTTPNEQKPVISAQLLRQTLAELILANPDRQLSKAGNRIRWGKKVAEMLDYLGADGNNLLIQIINQLPTLEQTLVLEVSSLNLLQRLDYLDLDQCSEVHFAIYLRNTSFEKIETRDDHLDEILTALIERSGDLNLQYVLDILCNIKYKDQIFKSLWESAKFRGYRDKLIYLFSSHPQTSHLADKLQEELRSESDEEEKLPYRRIL